MVTYLRRKSKVCVLATNSNSKGKVKINETTTKGYENSQSNGKRDDEWLMQIQGNVLLVNDRENKQIL
jgi:hypothetical protein